MNGALQYGMPEKILVAVKKNEVAAPINEAIKTEIKSMDLIFAIIDRATKTLNKFVKLYLYGGLEKRPEPGNDLFYRMLNSCRGKLVNEK